VGGKRLTTEQESQLKLLLQQYPELTNAEIGKLIGTSENTVGNERRGERCKHRRARAETLVKAQAALGGSVAPAPAADIFRDLVEPTTATPVQQLRDELEREALLRLRAQLDSGEASPVEVLEALGADP
jgi:hypothetical protein